MKAVVKTKKGPGVEVGDVDIPEIGENDFLVKIAAASICGTDVHLYTWEENKEGPNWWDKTLKLPVVLGHEFSGEVVQVGNKVKTVSPGDRIISMSCTPCGACATCRSGKSEFCLNAIIGLNMDGAMAEYLKLPATAPIFKLPENVTYKQAALIEPLSVALQGILVSGIRPGDSAAMFGPGPIGLLTIQLLKAVGAGPLFVTGMSADKNRLDLAKHLGADVTVNVEKENLVKKVREVTRGEGLDLVFEAAGAPSVLPQALAASKAFGTIVFLGMYAGSAAIDLNQLVIGNKRMIGSMGFEAATMKRAIDLVANGIVSPELIIGREFSVEQGVAAFESLVKKEIVKALLVP